MRSLLLWLLFLTSVFVCLVQTLPILGGGYGLLFPWLLILSCLAFYRNFRKGVPKHALLAGLSLAILLIIGVKGMLLNYSASSPDKATIEIKVLSYNTYFKAWNGQSAAELVKQAKPDLALVQEFTPEHNEAYNAALIQDLPYRKVVPRNGTHGIGVYSKWPVKHVKKLLNDAGMTFAHITDINIETKKVRVINCHLASPARSVENPDHFVEYFQENHSTRRKQILEIIELVKACEDEFDLIILGGDLNTMRIEPHYRTLVQHFEDTRTIFDGIGYNFPNSSKVPALTQLDYIMIHGRASYEGFEVLSGGPSDHKAITVNIEL